MIWPAWKGGAAQSLPTALDLHCFLQAGMVHHGRPVVCKPNRQAFEIAMRLAGISKPSTTLWLDDRWGEEEEEDARGLQGTASRNTCRLCLVLTAPLWCPPCSARNITTGHRLGLYSVLVGRTGGCCKHVAAV